MSEPTSVTTEFVRRHYAMGPTAYREDGSIARMPKPEDVAYCERQFDAWLAEHDAALIEGLADKWEALVQREKPPVRGSLWLREKARQRREEQP